MADPSPKQKESSSSSSSSSLPPPSTPKEYKLLLLELPEVLLHSILSFAAPSTERAFVLCHQLGPTCSLFHSAVETGLHNVWSMILCKDYNGVDESNNIFSSDKQNNGCQKRRIKQRKSKRLKCSIKSTVESSHRLLLDRTEVAHYALSEMVVSSRTPLTLARLRWIMREYGPVIKVNHVQRVGGTFLVECCRARHVKECVVLRCVKELVEKHGADVNLAAASENKRGRNNDSSSNNNNSCRKYPGGDSGGLTPLIIASARGMPTVVAYLLNNGASPNIIGTGRFRLYSNSSKSVSGTYDPLTWSIKMAEKEIENGLPKESLQDLNRCTKLLQKAK